MAVPIVDLYLAYQFLRRLATPFTKWDAYKLGIIDEHGVVLRKRKTLKNSAELNAWGHFDIIAANLKKLLGRVPGGEAPIASIAAALLLLKEEIDDEDLVEQRLKEDVAVNNVGGGNVAGVGVGPNGEPGIKGNKYQRKNALLAKKLLKREYKK